jgi:hypothetical protein
MNETEADMVADLATGNILVSTTMLGLLIDKGLISRAEALERYEGLLVASKTNGASSVAQQAIVAALKFLSDPPPGVPPVRN